MKKPAHLYIIDETEEIIKEKILTEYAFISFQNLSIKILSENFTIILSIIKISLFYEYHCTINS